MKLIATAITTALALLLAIIAPATAAPSARYGTGTIQIADVQLKEYGCFDHPYSVTVTLGPETTEWYVDVDVLAPNGTYFEQDSTYLQYGSGVHTINGTVFFCSSIDPPGTYTIRGIVGTYEGASDYTPTETLLQGRTFSVLAYAPPPPPPPPPAPPVTDVDGRAKRIAKPLTAMVRFVSESTPAGHTTGRMLRWQVRWDGRRSRITQGPDEISTFKRKFPAGSGAHKVKVYKNGARVMTFVVRTA